MDGLKWWLPLAVAIAGWTGYGVYKFGELNQRITYVESRLEKLPPPWLLDDVRDLRHDLRNHREHMEDHRTREHRIDGPPRQIKMR